MKTSMIPSLDVYNLARRSLEDAASERRHALQTLLDNAHLDLPELLQLEEKAATADERYQVAKAAFGQFNNLIQTAQNFSLSQSSSVIRG
jgi:hypothetical protein